MSKFKIGDKAIYLTDEIEVEVEILDIFKRGKEYADLEPDTFYYKIIKRQRIEYAG